MPLPKTQNVETLIRMLKKEKPNMPKKQRLAIALTQARKAGAKIPQPKE